jgi:hypothetical protein
MKHVLRCMPNVIKLFEVIIYKCSQEAREFALGRPFQLSLMFVSKAGACPSEVPFRGSCTFQQTFDWSKKACQ